MNNALLFVHIPKSAGTSFRNGLEKKYGNSKILRDYTYDAPETSSVIKKLIYESGDLYKLGTYLDNKNVIALAGHFPINKYAHLFSIRNMVTFVREPVARIISEYQHYVRHKSYTGSLLEFAKLPKKKNLQSRYLAGLPISSIGLIGITEFYTESVSLLQKNHNIKIPVLINNVTPEKNKYLETIDKDTVEKIKVINKKDLALYDTSVELHRRRMNLNKKGLPYVYGQYHLLPNNRLGGWAFFEDSKDVVTVNVIWSGQVQLELIASQFNVMMRSYNSPRKGFVGFKFKLPSDINIKNLECRVKGTNQLLMNMTQ